MDAIETYEPQAGWGVGRLRVPPGTNGAGACCNEGATRGNKADVSGTLCASGVLPGVDGRNRCREEGDVSKGANGREGRFDVGISGAVRVVKGPPGAR